MKFGIRVPSLKKRIVARTSIKRMIRAKIRVPKGYGVFTNPKKALYNRIYNRTSISADRLIKGVAIPKSKSHNADTSQITSPVNSDCNIIQSSHHSLVVNSENFNDLKNQITNIYENRVEKRHELSKVKAIYYLITFIHVCSYILIFGFFYRGISYYLNKRQKMLDDINNEISNLYVSLKFADNTQFKKSWLNCTDAFRELINSKKIWDLTYSQVNNRVAERTIADTSFTRNRIHQQSKNLEFIKSDLDNLYLVNTNGPDIYIYPTFLILFENYNSFSIYDLCDLDLRLELTSFIEEEGVPEDTTIISHTWKKANKDGSMDKRFNGNYQIPIVKYGKLSIQSKTGIDECYMFSDFNAFSTFAESFVPHIKKLYEKH